LNSRSEPAKQLGTHSGFSVCCRAELGSDGITALTYSLLGSCDTLLQALQCIASAISIIFGLSQLVLCIVVYLPCRALAPIRFLKSAQRRPPITLGNLDLVVAKRSSGLGCIGVRGADTQLLQSHEQKADRRHESPCRDQF
jgi:hypothetical protein